MNKQEYQHIRNLAWDLLIDANINSLPTDISKIAHLYHITNIGTGELFDKTLVLSSQILKIFGYNNQELVKPLAIRILCPMIIVKELNVHSAEEMSIITKLPIDISKQRFQRYEMLLTRNAFETSELESKLLLQFNDWINSQKINF